MLENLKPFREWVLIGLFFKFYNTLFKFFICRLIIHYKSLNLM